MGRAILALGITVFCFGASAADQPPKRTMGLKQGPQTVFDQPPQQFVAELAGAELNGQNGRVGRELVFWGYRQSTGRSVFLFACAPRADFDCMDRVQLICPTGTTVLSTQERGGNVVRRNCRTIAIDAPNSPRPGCNERVEDEAPLLIGVVSCG